MAQQTAVDWFFDNLKNHQIQAEHFELYQQALAMEKEQIIKAFSDGQETPLNHPTLPHYSREEYYNDTYKTT